MFATPSFPLPDHWSAMALSAQKCLYNGNLPAQREYSCQHSVPLYPDSCFAKKVSTWWFGYCGSMGTLYYWYKMIQPNLATLTEMFLGSGSSSKGKCESNGYPTGHEDWGWAHAACNHTWIGEALQRSFLDLIKRCSKHWDQTTYKSFVIYYTWLIWINKYIYIYIST